MSKTRNFHAVNAHMRRSGPMKDRKKETNKNNCRESIEETDEDCTGIICLPWGDCPNPELCQEECFDADLTFLYRHTQNKEDKDV